MRTHDPLNNALIPCNFFGGGSPPPPPPPVKIPPPPPPLVLPPPPPPPEIPKQKAWQIYGADTMYRKWRDKAAAGGGPEATRKAERYRTLAEQQEPGSTTAPTLAEQMEALKPLPLPPPIPPPPPTPPPPSTSALEAQEAASEVQRQQKKRKGTSASIIAGEQSAPYATSTAETGSLLG